MSRGPRSVALLGALYFVQGMPFGFQANALSAFLRESGMSRTGIGLLSVLALPWLFKPLLGPLVDRFGSARFGRRKSWIVPLQALLALTCVAASFFRLQTDTSTVLWLILLMNVFAATQDVAVDGLAVGLLSERELGVGNIAQVVGYKTGMLTGGGVLVWLSGHIGWNGMFWAMAGLCLAVMTAMLLFRESAATEAATAREPPRFREVWERVKQAAKSPGTGALLVFVASYKVGEALADRMYTPFLIDKGHTPAEVGLWLGVWGMGASLLGSTLGGVLASRRGLLEAVVWTASVRALPLGLQWAQTAGLLPTDAPTVIVVSGAEHFFGGALTTCMFALMMSRVDRRIGATHYTLLASVEVGGKSLSSAFSGKLADTFEYPPVFLAAVLLSVAFVLLAIPLKRSLAPRPAEAA